MRNAVMQSTESHVLLRQERFTPAPPGAYVAAFARIKAGEKFSEEDLANGNLLDQHIEYAPVIGFVLPGDINGDDERSSNQCSYNVEDKLEAICISDDGFPRNAWRGQDTRALGVFAAGKEGRAREHLRQFIRASRGMLLNDRDE